jgi:hypothetical protein
MVWFDDELAARYRLLFYFAADELWKALDYRIESAILPARC